MDNRMALQAGHTLCLGGTAYRVISCLGRGANALAYQAAYEDATLPGQLHRVLLKELFPWRPEGGVGRNCDGSVHIEREATDFFALHRESFLRGNHVHLEMQCARGEKVPANLNTYQAGNTLYTVLGDAGGQTLQAALEARAPIPLTTLTVWMCSLLYSLRAFHEQGLLHLDVSPDNILLLPLDHGRPESAREVLLIDYNSAWSRDELAHRGEIFLSLKEPYSAPEVRLQDLRAVGPPSDLYSVCVIFLTGLLGTAPEGGDMERRFPALGSAPALQGVPTTAFHQAATILRRGMRAPPRRRYQSADEAIEVFTELLERLEGGGVTRAALWEASVQQFHTAVGRMPDGAELGAITEANATSLSALEGGGSCLITGVSGSGKTTALLGLWLRGTARYLPSAPVSVYLPMYAYDGKGNYIHRALLGLLRLPPGEGWTKANHTLARLLNTPEQSGPSVRLLLDGVDEAVGDVRPLLIEIRALAGRAGVQVIATARRAVSELALPEQSMPTLMAGEVAAYLGRHGVPVPTDSELAELLRTPVLLSLYAKTHDGMEGRPTADAAGLLADYLDGLISDCRKQDGEDAGLRAEFAVRVLLPLLVSRMNGRPMVSPNTVCQTVDGCFALLRRRRFLRALPQYLGHTGTIRGGAEDAEAWFGLMVRELLERRLALLWQDGQGNYHLFHQRFQPLLAERWGPYRKRLTLARLRSLVPAVLAALLCTALIWGWYVHTPAAPGSYPRTAQERRTADLAVNELILSCGLADLQFAAEARLLDAANEDVIQGTDGAWGNWLQAARRELVTIEALNLSTKLSQERMEALSDAPLLQEAMGQLYALPSTLRPELLRRMESLSRCLSPDSAYSETDRRQAVEGFRRLLDSETAESFLLLGQVISALDREAAAPLLEFLSYTSAWRTQLRQADWEGTDYVLGLAACRGEQKELRTELAALGLIPYEEE